MDLKLKVGSLLLIACLSVMLCSLERQVEAYFIGWYTPTVAERVFDTPGWGPMWPGPYIYPYHHHHYRAGDAFVAGLVIGGIATAIDESEPQVVYVQPVVQAPRQVVRQVYTISPVRPTRKLAMPEEEKSNTQQAVEDRRVGEQSATYETQPVASEKRETSPHKAEAIRGNVEPKPIIRTNYKIYPVGGFASKQGRKAVCKNCVCVQYVMS